MHRIYRKALHQIKPDNLAQGHCCVVSVEVYEIRLLLEEYEKHGAEDFPLVLWFPNHNESTARRIFWMCIHAINVLRESNTLQLSLRWYYRSPCAASLGPLLVCIDYAGLEEL